MSTYIQKLRLALSPVKVRNFTQSVDVIFIVKPKSKKTAKLNRIDLRFSSTKNKVWYISNQPSNIVQTVSPKKFGELITEAAGNYKQFSDLKLVLDQLVVVSFLRANAKILSKLKIKPIVAKPDKLADQVSDLMHSRTFKLNGPSLQLKLGSISEGVESLNEKLSNLKNLVETAAGVDYQIAEIIVKTTMGASHKLS